MVLDHIGQRTGFLIIGPASFDADRFRCRDLNVIYVPAIPERFKYPIAETKSEDILNSLFTEVVINAIDIRFTKNLVELIAQLARARQVVPERFLDDQAPPPASLPQSRPAQSQSGGRVLTGLRGQVKQHVAASVARGFDFRKLLLKAAVQRGIFNIARQVKKPACKRLPNVFVDFRVLREAL